MFFLSTRKPGVVCKFRDTVLNPIVGNKGGVFVPSFVTPMDFASIEKIACMPYPQAVAEIVYQWCDGCFSKETLLQLTEEAFKDFGRGFGMLNNDCVGDRCFSTLSLEPGVETANLTYGPTGCCKDYGYNFAASLINYFAEQDGIIRNVVDCSGGSSGPSTVWAVKNKKFLRGIAILKAGKNVSAEAIVAKAVACSDNTGYAVVNCDDAFINDVRYELCNNDSLIETTNMTFINDLNLVAVFAYLPAFFKSYIKCNARPFSVSVPTSNASLAMAAFFAKKIGVPIRKIILSTEQNGFFYDIQNSKVAINKTQQNQGWSSLHAGIPTNFERILFYLMSSNQKSVQRTMEELESNMRYKMSDKLVEQFEEVFFVARCDNQFSIRNIIYSMINEKQTYVEQHFAIAKMGVDQATSVLGATITSSPVVIFNTLDFRRNLDFVNSSLGYDIERLDLPWTKEDVQSFAPVEIVADKNEVLRYIIDVVDNPEKLRATNSVQNDKKNEQKS